MKTIFFNISLCLFPIFALAQTKPTMADSNWTYPDIIYTDEVNGIDVFASDTFNQVVQKIIEQQRIKVPNPYDRPEVYFTNQQKDKYFKIWGGPDLGYGWYYAVGYTVNGRCKSCGTFLGKDGAADYVVNNGIKLGDDIKQVWEKAHLEYFRRFSFNGIGYFYFEKGVKNEVPFTPYKIFYYKFKNAKLIEIGFGYGMIGINPMLQPE